MSDLVGNPEDRFSRVEAQIHAMQRALTSNRVRKYEAPVTKNVLFHEKTNVLHMQKQRHRSASQLLRS